MSDAELRPVRLLGLPLDVHRRSSEHGETLRRELAFVEHASDPQSAPARLHQLGLSLAAKYGPLTATQDERLAEALAAGEATVDLDYRLPVEVADACDELEALLDQLDAYCREGDLLTLVTPPEGVAYRRWFLDEIRHQLRERREPRPWVRPKGIPVPEAASSEPGPPAGSVWTAGARIVVTDDLDLASAPVLRDEIVRRTEAGVTEVTVDLSDCGFLDSTGLSLLLTTHLRLAASGGSLRIVGARGQIAAVLEMSGVTDLLTDAAG